jgi:Protein of unknown function (DUF2795)
MATSGAIDMSGFEVEARDERVGRIHPATSEVDVSFIVVDAEIQRVLLPAGLITEVDEKRRKVVLSCTAAEVRGAPRFEEQQQTAPEPEAFERPAEPEEPTKDDLYAEAGRLGVRGRSTMTKDELDEELERLQTEKASPIDAQAFLDGVEYPVDKDDLLELAEKNRAGPEVMATLERLPNRRFEDPTDISRAIGELP